METEIKIPESVPDVTDTNSTVCNDDTNVLAKIEDYVEDIIQTTLMATIQNERFNENTSKESEVIDDFNDLNDLDMSYHINR